jgi:hypothetical protein
MPIIVLIMMLIAGCGQDVSRPDPVDISMTAIVWQGSANEDAVLLQKLNETMECLASLNVHKQGYPYVVIVKDLFICGEVPNAAGCMVYEKNTIYLQEIAPVFKHEVIHWATHLGLESEKTIYFTQCQVE